MPITTNLLLADGDDTDRTVYTTASISPTPNRLILACIMCADQGFTAAITTSTITGAGLTWVEIDEIGFDTTVSERRGFSIWRGLGPGATSGALTITLDGPGTAARWTVIEFPGCDTGGDNGANAVVQEANARTDADTSEQASLAAFADAANATYAYCGSGGINITLTEGTGFTKIGEVDLGTIKAAGEFRDDNDTSPDFTISGGDSPADMAIMAVELKFLDQATVVGTVVQHETFSETDATTYATSSWTPAADKVHLACFSGRRSTAPMSTPTLAGNGITWTEIVTSSAESAQAKMTLFRGIAVAPTTGVTTFTLAETNLRGCFTFIELSNVDTGTGGADAIVQSDTATGDTVTAVAASLSAFGADLNATIEFCTGDNPNGVVFSEGLGFTKIVDLLDDASSNFNCQIVGFRVGNDLTPNFTVTGSNQPMHMIGVELKFLADPIQNRGAHGRLGFAF